MIPSPVVRKIESLANNRNFNKIRSWETARTRSGKERISPPWTLPHIMDVDQFYSIKALNKNYSLYWVNTFLMKARYQISRRHGAGRPPSPRKCLIWRACFDVDGCSRWLGNCIHIRLWILMTPLGIVYSTVIIYSTPSILRTVDNQVISDLSRHQCYRLPWFNQTMHPLLTKMLVCGIEIVHCKVYIQSSSRGGSSPRFRSWCCEALWFQWRNKSNKGRTRDLLDEVTKCSFPVCPWAIHSLHVSSLYAVRQHLDRSDGQASGFGWTVSLRNVFHSRVSDQDLTHMYLILQWIRSQSMVDAIHHLHLLSFSSWKEKEITAYMNIHIDHFITRELSKSLIFEKGASGESYPLAGEYRIYRGSLPDRIMC